MEAVTEASFSRNLTAIQSAYDLKGGGRASEIILEISAIFLVRILSPEAFHGKCARVHARAFSTMKFLRPDTERAS